jgi:diacylglycerol O-acyltransferase / wax synthase
MRERLGSVDAAWFHMDRPENTADVVGMLVFRELPRFERLRAVIEERLVSCPRFRQRVVPGAGFAPGRWEDDPYFDLERHLVRLRVDGGREALAARLDVLASMPLDPAHPLWRVEVVEGGAEPALLVKLHHCIADGFALVSLLLSLADDPPEPHLAAHAMAGFQRLAPWLDPQHALAPALRRPGGAAALALQAVSLGAALARMTALPRDPPTAWQRPLSGTRHVAWSSGAPLRAVRRAARAHGGTVNDVLLAALSGAVRAELAHGGEAVDTLRLRALVPVNLRPGPPHALGGELGNRFGLVFLDLPVSQPRRAARLAVIRARMAELKRRPDALAAFGMLGLLGLAHPLAHLATAFFTRKASLVVTNVPGPRHRLHLAGHAIEHAMFWVPHPATLGVGVSILTYAGEVRIGVRADVAVLPAPERLVAAFERELAALTAASPGAGAVARAHAFA